MSQPEERAKKKQKRPEGDDEVIIVCEGQTVEERRELRAELRDIATEISVRGQALHDADKPDFKTIVERNDSAFKKVRYAREAVLEATNFDRLSTAVQKQVQGLATSVRRYNYQDFVKALQQHAEFGSVRKIVDWRKLGAAVGSCFQCVPEVEFMMGPLDKPDAPRKERAKCKKATGGDDDAEEVEPEQLTAKRDKQEDATTKRVKRMKHLIINNIAEPGARSALPKEVDLFSFVFNPNSFTQTVENMFDMSFQAKEQFAALEMNEEGIPVVRRTALADDADAAPPPKTSQAVISFTMEDWKELCEAYGVTECRVEDRPGYEPDPVLQKMMSEQQKNRSHRILMVGYTLGRRRHPPQPVLEKALSTASINTAATESTVSSSAASSIASSPRGNSSSLPSFGHRCTDDLPMSSSGHHSAGSSSPGRRSPTSTVSSSSSSSSSHPSSRRSGAAASSKSRERSLRGHGHRTHGHRTSSKSPRPASAPSSTTTAAVKPPPPPPPHTGPSPHAAAAAEPRAGSVCLQPPQLDHDDYDMLGALKPSLMDAVPPAHVMPPPPAPSETLGPGLSAESVGDAHVRGRGLGQGDIAGSGCGGGRGCGGSACGGGGGTGGGGADSVVREVTHEGGHGVSETDSLLPSAEASSLCHDRASAPSSADREPTGTPATTTTTSSYGTMTLYSDSPSPTHTDTRERRRGGFLAWLCAMLCCVTALVIVPWRLMRRRPNCARDDFNTHTDTQADSGVDDDDCLDETVENLAGHARGDEGLMGAPRREGAHSVDDNDPVGVRERGGGRCGATDSCGVEGRPACVAVHEECARAAEGVPGEVGRGEGHGDGGASVGVQEGNDREAQARKGDAKACEITVLALRMFAGQRDLQVETLSAVWALAWAAEHNRCVLAEAGAGDLCVSAVRTSAGDAEVCYNALGALSVVTHDVHTRARLRKVDGACGVLVKCVSAHKRSAPIVDVALRVLTNLAADVASRDVLIGANVVDVVIVALRTHTRQRSVVRGALALVNNLLSLSDLNTNNNNNKHSNRHTNHSTSSSASLHADACHTGSFNLSESLMKSACVCASGMGSQMGCESLCAAMRAFDCDAEISEPAHDAPSLPLRDTCTETHAHTHTDVHRLVCRALWLVVCVCRGCHDSKWAMGEAGACQAVVKVLRAFEGDSNVQKLGYDAIRHLLGDGNNNRWLREAEPDELIAAALEAAQVHAELKSRDDDAWRTRPLRRIARPSPTAECITA